MDPSTVEKDIGDKSHPAISNSIPSDINFGDEGFYDPLE